MEQRIEFSTGSAALAALAEAFDYFQRIAEDFDLSEIRAAAAVKPSFPYGEAREKPPPSLSAAEIRFPFRRTVKARVCRIGRGT